MGAVREHGGGAAAAQGAGRPLRAAARGGGRRLRGPALLPRPRRLHGRGVHLRQPPHRAPRPVVPVEGNAILGLPPAAPACKRPAATLRPAPPLPVPVAVSAPVLSAATLPPAQRVPAKAAGSCVGEVEAPGIPASAIRSCPEHACMQV